MPYLILVLKKNNNHCYGTDLESFHHQLSPYQLINGTLTATKLNTHISRRTTPCPLVGVTGSCLLLSSTTRY